MGSLKLGGEAVCSHIPTRFFGGMVTLLEVFEKLTDLLRQGATDDAARTASSLLTSIPYSEIEMPVLSIRLNRGIFITWSTDRGCVEVVIPRVTVSSTAHIPYLVKKNEWSRVQHRETWLGNDDHEFSGYCMDIAGIPDVLVEK